MKKVIHNNDNLSELDINNYVYRAKMLIINSNDEILLCKSALNYHFPGGHVEEGETYDECIVRELKEETGINIPLEKREPFMQIIYLSKDYPKVGLNSKHTANYYYIKSDIKPNLKDINLTEDEKNGQFTLQFIHKDEILNVLKESLKLSTREGVTKDTISVLEEFLKNYI